MIETFVKIRHRFEGFHQWKEAPDEVSFLRQSHRHLFHVTVEIGVSHDDRELEFFIEQRFLKTLFDTTEQCDNQSCETLARYVVMMFQKRHGYDRPITCEVSEDGENSGVVKYTPNLGEQ